MYDINRVKELCQEEGLNDREISDILGCSRLTVTRIRKRNNIPLCKKENKKDKYYFCCSCNKKIYIRRKETRRAFCEKCGEEYEQYCVLSSKRNKSNGNTGY